MLEIPLFHHLLEFLAMNPVETPNKFVQLLCSLNLKTETFTDRKVNNDG